MHGPARRRMHDEALQLLDGMTVNEREEVATIFDELSEAFRRCAAGTRSGHYQQNKATLLAVMPHLTSIVVGAALGARDIQQAEQADAEAN